MVVHGRIINRLRIVLLAAHLPRLLITWGRWYVLQCSDYASFSRSVIPFQFSCILSNLIDWFNFFGWISTLTVFWWVIIFFFFLLVTLPLLILFLLSFYFMFILSFLLLLRVPLLLFFFFLLMFLLLGCQSYFSRFLLFPLLLISLLCLRCLS